MTEPSCHDQSPEVGAGMPIGFQPFGWWQDALEASAGRLSERLATIYGEDEQRWPDDRRAALTALLEGFKQRYGDGRPVAIARAPGRLNTLGRHIDHRGGCINPISLQFDTLLAFCRRDDDMVRADDLAPEFGARQFGIGDLLPGESFDDIPSWLNWTQQLADRRAADNTRSDWVHKLAAPAVYLQQMYCADRRLCGYDGLLSSSVPRAMGLSSSSCVVVVGMEALLAVNKLDLATGEYALRCGAAEWYVGTRGGCGDHAAIKFGRRDRITHARTEPSLEIRGHLPFPEGYRLLVFDSGVVANKTGTAGQQFNEKTATYAIGELYIRSWLRQNHRQLYDSLDAERGDRPVDRRIYLADLVEQLAESALFELLEELPKRRTRQELRREWSDESSLLESYFATHGEPDSYPIRDVITFGLSECTRSARLAEVLAAGDVATYGRFMNLSQHADRVAGIDRDTAIRKWSIDPSVPLQEHCGDYHCSLEPLDQMVDVALAAGALGAQVSGAGLGGSVMVLLADDQADGVIEAMRKRYYEPTGRKPEWLTARTSAGAGLL